MADRVMTTAGPTTLTILGYHDVCGDDPSVPTRLRISERNFSEQLDELSTWPTVALRQGLDQLVVSDAGHRFAITVDDGFASAVDRIAPLLLERRLPATFFVSTAKIGRAIYEAELGRTCTYASTSQLADLHRAGFEVAAHGRTHPKLPALRIPSLVSEIFGSICDLEDIIGAAVRTFCYPYGAYTATAISVAAAAGADAACTTIPGSNDASTSRMTLRRIAIKSDVDRTEFGDAVRHEINRKRD